MKKRGQAGIIAVILLVLLVIVVAVIILGMSFKFFDKSKENAQSADLLNVRATIEIFEIDSENNAIIVIEKNNYGKDLKGVKFIFEDENENYYSYNSQVPPLSGQSNYTIPASAISGLESNFEDILLVSIAFIYGKDRITGILDSAEKSIISEENSGEGSCGDKIIDSGEECEEDNDCSGIDVCSLSCQCVCSIPPGGSPELVSVSTNPDSTVNHEGSGVSQNVFVNGDYAFVSINVNRTDYDVWSVDIWDISNPKTPILVSTYETKRTSLLPGSNQKKVKRISVLENKLYVAIGSEGFEIADISDKSNPQELYYYNATESNEKKFNWLYAEKEGTQTYLYVTHSPSSPNPGNISIFDVTNPESITRVTGISLGEGLISDNQAVKSGDYIYTRSNFNGIGEALSIIDVSDKTNPVFVSNTTFLGIDLGQIKEIKDNMLFVTTDEGFIIINVSDKLTPIEIADYNFDSIIDIYSDSEKPNNIFVSGDPGIHLINISDSRNPSLITSYSESVENIFVRGNYIYAADWFNELRIIDFCNCL